eukprot:4932283-Prymnesium_polylepis.2
MGQANTGQMFYNEIIVSAMSWRANVAGTVEAIFGDCNAYQRFLTRYKLDESEHPCLRLAPSDWDSPFHEG